VGAVANRRDCAGAVGLDVAGLVVHVTGSHLAGADDMTDPKITQLRSGFSLVCGVEVNIRATAERIWSVLTDAENFPRWNSTVADIEGRIAEGARLRIRVPGTDRIFTARVSGVVPTKRMVWTGGFTPIFKGVRTFDLSPRGDGSTDFAMEQRFSGLMLPLVRGPMPDFGPVFERYANDRSPEAPAKPRGSGRPAPRLAGARGAGPVTSSPRELGAPLLLAT
jgi:uncharacterized protein YndB with AHSA1/START domain